MPRKKDTDWLRCDMNAPGCSAEPGTYESSLPFYCHDADNLPRHVNLEGDAQMTVDHQWSSDASQIASEALERGYVISVYAHPAYALRLAAELVQQLTESTFVTFDEDNRRLLLWAKNPRSVSIETERVVC